MVHAQREISWKTKHFDVAAKAVARSIECV